jgi:hypothetical protein
MLSSLSTANLSSTDHSASRPQLEETGLQSSASALLSAPELEYPASMAVQELDETKSTIADLELVKDCITNPEFSTSQVCLYFLNSPRLCFYLMQPFCFLRSFAYQTSESESHDAQLANALSFFNDQIADSQPKQVVNSASFVVTVLPFI